MLKVLWPMEPVEPRTAIFFTPFILVLRGRRGGDRGKGIGEKSKRTSHRLRAKERIEIEGSGHGAKCGVKRELWQSA